MAPWGERARVYSCRDWPSATLRALAPEAHISGRESKSRWLKPCALATMGGTDESVPFRENTLSKVEGDAGQTPTAKREGRGLPYEEPAGMHPQTPEERQNLAHSASCG
jgi:hypothetical protein